MSPKGCQRSKISGILLLLVFLLASPGTLLSAYSAEPAKPTGGIEEGHLTAEKRREADRGNPSRPSLGSERPIGPTTEPKLQYKFEPVCIIDDAYVNLTCVARNERCSLGANGTLMRVYEAPADQDPPQWMDTGEQICRDSGAPRVEDEDAPIVVTLDFFRRLPIAPSTSVVQPMPHTLVGTETNVYAKSSPQVFYEEIDGEEITLRAIPVSYEWDYGDGSFLGPIEMTGGHLSESEYGKTTATSHRYLSTGDYPVTLRTHYRGEYSLNGRDWIAIQGQTSVASPPIMISVWRSVVNNYADNCLENPNGAGC